MLVLVILLVFCGFLANFEFIEMNRYDYLVAFGAFSAGLAAGRYFWADTSVHKDLSATKREFNKCADERNTMRSAASGKCSHANGGAGARADEEVAEVLFFPDHGYTCDEFSSNPDGCTTENCQFLHHETSLGYTKNNYICIKFLFF